MTALKTNLKLEVSLFWYNLLMLLTNLLEGIYTNILEFSDFAETNEFKSIPKIISFLIKGSFPKIRKIVNKQLIYLNRERIYYTRSLLLTILFAGICTLFKPFLIAFLAIKSYSIFILPIRCSQRLTYKYIFFALLGIPLLTASLYFDGIVGVTLSALSFLYMVALCNPRSYADKYKYCLKQ